MRGLTEDALGQRHERRLVNSLHGPVVGRSGLGLGAGDAPERI
jgi:hypothetical protein